MTVELFELEMLGGPFERRYRRARPEVEQMPWGTLDVRNLPEAVVVAGRRVWTGAAFQEHRTAVACAATLRALLEIRAPLDLVAMASRFPMDELVHVEMCARIAMELGGGTEITQDPDLLVRDADADLPPFMRAAELVVRFFCVGEALSIPLLRASWKASEHALPKAVLGRIVKDEAAHGTFGFTFLDWAEPRLGTDERKHLGAQADIVIRAIHRQWDAVRARTSDPFAAEIDKHRLSWMETKSYLALAMRSMNENVIEPLEARGIPISAKTLSAPT